MWWFDLGGGLGDVDDYVRSVDKMFVDWRWNSGHVYNSYSVALLKDNTLFNF